MRQLFFVIFATVVTLLILGHPHRTRKLEPDPSSRHATRSVVAGAMTRSAPIAQGQPSILSAPKQSVIGSTEKVVREPASDSSFDPSEFKPRPLYEVNDWNFSKIDQICKGQSQDDWQDACVQLATYYAKHSEWKAAMEYAAPECAEAETSSCGLMLKLAWHETFDDDVTYQEFRNICNMPAMDWSGRIYSAEDQKTFIYPDVENCAAFRKDGESQSAWHLALDSLWSAPSQTLGDYIRSDF